MNNQIGRCNEEVDSMIYTKKDLKEYIEADLGGKSVSFLANVKDWILRNESFYLRRYIVVLRKLEYYKNNSNNILSRLLYLYYFVRYKRIMFRTKIELYPNRVGKGCRLFHFTGDKLGAVPEALIGEHVILRPGTVLGYQGDTMRESMAAPIVDDYVEFSWGVKVFGKIHIGRGAVLHANCVPLSNVPPYAIVAGNPAKVIGFTKNPDEVIAFEKEHYEEKDRLSKELLEKNYKKYFLDRIKEIKQFAKV